MTTPRGRVLDLNLHVLDRQIVDRDGRMVGKADDLELEMDADGRPRVTAILTGPLALGPRLGGRLGNWMCAVARRLAGGPDAPHRIDIALVSDIGSAITVSVSHEDLDNAALERWVDTHVVSRIPGSHHAG